MRTLLREKSEVVQISLKGIAKEAKLEWLEQSESQRL